MQIHDGKTIAVDVGGTQVETFYFQAGEPARGDLLLMHTGGAGASALMCWYLNFDALVAAGYRVTAPDAPGFGRSVVASDGNVKATDFVPAFMDALGITQAHMAGNSMGGVTLSHVAAAHPGRVLSLTLSGGEPRVVTDAVVAIGSLGATPRNNFVREMFGKPQLALADLRHATADFVFDRDLPALDAVTQIRFDTLSEAGAYERAKEGAMGQVARRGSGADLSAADYLADIQAPTFLLHGRDEPWFYPDEHRAALTDAAMKAAMVIPNCTATFLPHCGHWPQLEHPERYNALLLEFLASVS
jgi:2-hydroxy-6-oxonona-2,4-dienedioate hydrolase